MHACMHGSRYSTMSDTMVGEVESVSESHLPLLHPPLKKMYQCTAQFGTQAKRMLAALSSQPLTINTTDTTLQCHLPGSEGVVATFSETVSACCSDCCKDMLRPYQPSEPCKIKRVGRRNVKHRQFCPTWFSSYLWLTRCFRSKSILHLLPVLQGEIY